MSDEKRGLYQKYEVKRLNDPEDKHLDCEYFVLDLEHDKFSRAALIAYAGACKAEFPNLAVDLMRRVDYRMRDEERLAEAVHDAYLTTCARLGWPVKPANAVPYAELTEESKELDRASVRAVLAALAATP